VSVIFPQPSTFIPQLGRSVTIDRAAQLLGVSRRTVYNRIKDGRLLTLRTPGGSQRVLLVSLQQLAAESSVSGRGEAALA
jgi:excisionase family DNA binding protein